MPWTASSYGTGVRTGNLAQYGGVLGYTDLEAVLNDLVIPNIKNLVVNQTDALKLFETHKLNWDGYRRGRGKLQTAMNGSFQAYDEGGAFGAAGANEYREYEVRSQNISGVMAFSGNARNAASGRGGVIDIVKSETKGLVDTFRFNLQRMLWGNGSGILGTVSSYSNYVITLTVVANARNFRPGQLVVYGTPSGSWPSQTWSGGNPVGYGRVSAVDYVLGKVTLDSAKCDVSTPPASPMVVVPGTYDAAAYGSSLSKEFMGLGALVDHTTYPTIQGIDSSSVAEWATQAFSESGAALTERMMLGHVMKYKRANDVMPSHILMSDNMILEYFELLQPDVRYTPLKLTGGSKKLSFTTPDGEVPMIQDQFMADNALLYLDASDLKYTWQQELGFLKNPSGGILHRFTKADREEAVHYGYGNFMTTNRRSLMYVSAVGNSE